ncbi:MAG: NAD(P)/FAD-dependent oxidoreductase [Candidatus Margulisbacteria bacterium]|nr:NAD(P)/FAD-dependent oxidoreductase [Candidatus Margulisiibacteriota bacterium]
MAKIRCAIIGAGVIGLAAAEALTRKLEGDIVIFERREKFGQETSSRNSEVIHAGLYYPKNSLKSRLSLLGNKMLYELCRTAGIKHKKCGKIIVSTNEQEAAKIKAIYENAVAVGVPELSLLSRQEVIDLEPNVSALSGVYSGSSGIIDSHGLMEYLYLQARENGVMFAFGQEVTGIDREEQGGGGRSRDGFLIKTKEGETISAEYVINCAGLSADRLAEIAGLDIDKLGYRLHYCKGDYFSVAGSQDMINRLVYPVPHEKGYGLGVHATLDLNGFVRLGPDATYVKEISYDVDPGKRPAFYRAAKTYLPWLKEEMLSPDTAGIRPKLQGPDDGFRDFIIQEESANGLPGFVNLIGIESPGLTASLAIGQWLADLIG